jgi:hypothetical protein
MKKINNYLIYKLLCDKYNAKLYEPEDKAMVQTHMKNLMFRFAKENNIKFEEYDSNILFEEPDKSLSTEILNDIHNIIKNEKADKFSPLGSDEEINELLDLIGKSDRIKQKNNYNPPTKDEFKNNIEYKLNSKINKVLTEAKYKPPFMLKLLSFIPSVKSIIVANEQKYKVEHWNQLNDDDKKEFISNTVIKQCLETLKK